MQRRAAAPDLVAVHEVVVNEQIGVEQLDPEAGVEGDLARAARRLAAEQDERAADALAAAQGVVAQERMSGTEIDGQARKPFALAVEKFTQPRVAGARVVGEVRRRTRTWVGHGSP